MRKTMRKIRAFALKLRSDESGLAMIEFAYSLPLLIGISGYGLEMTNLAMTNHKISQATSALADNMSRVGLLSALSTTQIRESDVNDSFMGVDRQTNGLGLLVNGRVILSSLQQNATGGQWIAWQRCMGAKSIASSYGVQGDGATGTSFLGMGPTAARVQAPAGAAVMFAEIIYDYKPLFTTMFIPARTIKYHASFIVRDERQLAAPSPGDPDGIFNPSPAATVRSCSTFTAT
jgi:hypothetical protein